MLLTDITYWKNHKTLSAKVAILGFGSTLLLCNNVDFECDREITTQSMQSNLSGKGVEEPAM